MRTLTLAAGLVLASAVPALADPCTAPLPAPGTAFSGKVRYVGDGDMICTSDSADPSTWVEVRLADFYAPELKAPGGQEAKQTLQRLVMGKRADCLADHPNYDRIVAVCTVGGVSVGDLMRRAGVREGGNGYR